MIRLRLAIALGRLAGWASRLIGRGGSALPGLVAERIDPKVIDKLSSRLEVVVVTGTNGKTTTTKLIAAVLEAAGRRVITNRTGSNLARGVAGMLIAEASWSGRMLPAVAVLEIDEAALRTLAPRLTPELLLVTNLARDQLDRFGELATTAEHVAEGIRHSGQVVLNADDPLVRALAEHGDRVAFFGAVTELRELMPSDQGLYAGQVGPAQPSVDLQATLHRAVESGDGTIISIALSGAAGEAHLRLPGLYNAYNATAAALVGHLLGVPGEVILEALEGVAPAFGRGQVVEYRGRRVKVLLVKNPAGMNQAIRLLAGVPGPAPVLMALNDNHADGRDVSWIWDARIEDLAETGHRFGVTGIRASDLALRLKYAGVPSWVEPDLRRALNRFIEMVDPDETAYVVPTYTAMLALLDLLQPGRKRSEAWV